MALLGTVLLCSRGKRAALIPFMIASSLFARSRAFTSCQSGLCPVICTQRARTCVAKLSQSPANKRLQSTDHSLNDSVGDLREEDVSEEFASSKTDRGWRSIAWEDHQVEPQFNKDDFRVFLREELRSTHSPQKPSPVEKVLVRNRVVYFKRDDLLRLDGSNISGNKARKLFALNKLPAEEFPDCVVSYGGPQSNAMVAIAAIVQSKNSELQRAASSEEEYSDTQPLMPSYTSQTTLSDFNSERDIQFGATGLSLQKGVDASEGNGNSSTGRRKRFVYFAKRIPRFLRRNPTGNYFRAKSLGMELVELTNDEYQYFFGSTSGGKPDAPDSLEPPCPGNSLWIPQGGACGAALLGGRIQAKEIVLFWLMEGQGRPLSVCVPGGTCSTALILHREIKKLIEQDNLQLDIEVVVVPCVGDAGYARRQMMAVNMQIGGTEDMDELPFVLPPMPRRNLESQRSRSKANRYYSFGEPNPIILDTFNEMKDRNGVVVDLLYGAPSWAVILRHWQTSSTMSGVRSNEGDELLLGEREIMYVHSGGLEGINSQLMRYRHKGLVKGSEVQEPYIKRRKGYKKKHEAGS